MEFDDNDKENQVYFNASYLNKLLYENEKVFDYKMQNESIFSS